MANIGFSGPQEQDEPSTGPSRPQRQHSNWRLPLNQESPSGVGLECPLTQIYMDKCSTNIYGCPHKSVKVRETLLSASVIFENMEAGVGNAVHTNDFGAAACDTLEPCKGTAVHASDFGEHVHK